MGLYKVRLSRVYKKLLAIFLVACVVLVIFIVYVVFNKAVVKVKANNQTVDVSFPVNIIPDLNEESAISISGKINDVIIEKEKTYNSTGTKKVVDDVIGTVRIVNNYSQRQPLVASTRLLTSDNILLRIKESVDVPAGGEESVQVYADDPNSFNEIQPTQLTIPGLWEGLQDKIYAESDSVIKNTAGEVKFVQQKDIDRAKEELTELLYAQVAEDFSDNSEKGLLVVDHEMLEEEIGAELDDVTDSFNVKLKLRVTVVMFEKEKLYPLAGEKITSEMTKGFTLADIDLENFSYDVTDYDEEKETVSVSVSTAGNVKLDGNSEILDKQILMGLTKKGAELYLSSMKEIEWAEVDLSPFWVRHIPSFEDHIEIEIVE